MAKTYPPVFINNYLKEKITSYFESYPFDGIENEINIPFFPTTPTDIDALTETFPTSQGTFAVYDRMFKYRRTPFPHIKSEQLLYYFYKMHGNPELMMEISQLAYDLLDRGDESAEDLNAWIQSKVVNGVVTFAGVDFDPVYFHTIRMYQLEETRDIVDFGTARTYAGNKIILDYEYHSKGYPPGNNTTYNGTIL
jgi:hypothetical protein